ncbi:MAG: hypothetical protein AWU57_60 [Marinobacter sp. T13-3]|nr:MAG: hypothetical protein AWU57_60 [Marinobacter sp. T13-3]
MTTPETPGPSWAQRAAEGVSRSWNAMLEHPGLTAAANVGLGIALAQAQLSLNNAGINVPGSLTAGLWMASQAVLLPALMGGSDRSSARKQAAEGVAEGLIDGAGSIKFGGNPNMDLLIREALIDVSEHKTYWKAFTATLKSDDSSQTLKAVTDYLGEHGIELDYPEQISSNGVRKQVAATFGNHDTKDTLINPPAPSDDLDEGDAAPRMG